MRSRLACAVAMVTLLATPGCEDPVLVEPQTTADADAAREEVSGPGAPSSEAQTQPAAPATDASRDASLTSPGEAPETNAAGTRQQTPAGTGQQAPAGTGQYPAGTGQYPAGTGAAPGSLPGGQPGNPPTPPANYTPADVGVGQKGSSLRGETGVGRMIAQPAASLFAVRERAVFRIQIPHAMNLYKATQGNFPKSHQEFMTHIIQANRIALPELPPGQRYVYDPMAAQLMVERPQ